MDRLQKFVADVEGVDPQVTGHPVQTFYASRHMLRSYMHSGIYALIAVFILLYIDFQSVRMSLLAMMPLAIGCLVTAGTIGWLDIALNPANMIVLPLLLGIGVDDGVHLVHEFRRSRGRFEVGDSTAVAVVLTSTTTMVSFGTMILAQHRGLCSLGQVLTLGVLTCLLSSILIFPAVLGWLSRHRQIAEPESEGHLSLATAGNVAGGELWVVPLRSETQDSQDEYAEVRPALRRRPLRRTA
jgi:predicted RND superfamily exporter protein